MYKVRTTDGIHSIEATEVNVTNNTVVLLDGSSILFVCPIGKLDSVVKVTDKGLISDGYHTFNELYDYRKAYNALVFNEWAKQGINQVVKSTKHSEGTECFGGGWFIVSAMTPYGQVSNHYELKDWDLFQCEEVELGPVWDGHTPQEALERLLKTCEG